MRSRSIIFGAALAIFFMAMPYTQTVRAAVIQTAAQNTGLHADVSSGVAGYGAIMRVTGATPLREIRVNIVNPLGMARMISRSADVRGNATFQLPDDTTTISGAYRATVFDTYTQRSGNEILFSVYANGFDGAQATVTARPSLVRTRSFDFSVLDVVLRDSFGNPLSNHVVVARSNRSFDRIRPYQAGVTATNEFGRIRFAVTSDVMGESIYSFDDLNLGRTLSETARVLYTVDTASFGTASSSSLGVGGTFDSPVLQNRFIAQATGSGAGATHVVFDPPPTGIISHQPIDITLHARDGAEADAHGYRGTVHFAVVSGNAQFVTLPKDYTFVDNDLGTHIFALGLQFAQPGTYEVEARDTVQPDIVGSQTFVVGGGSSVAKSGSDVTFTAPSPGTYKDPVVSISGTGLAGKDINIYDNNESIGSTTAAIQGAFSFTTPALTDGPHTFTAVAVDQSGVVLGTSAALTITITTASATLNSVTLSPSFTVPAGTTMQVDAVSSPELSSVALDVQSVHATLTPVAGQPGTYHGTFAAPSAAGSYPLIFSLTDSFNSTQTVTYTQQLIVTAGIGGETVRGVRAAPEAFGVVLSWDPPSNGVSPAHYRIYYGTSPDSLSSVVDTNGPVTSWKVPNLLNGFTYYFGVVTVDAANTLGPGGTLVTATPSEQMGSSGGGNGEALFGAPGVAGETGPELLWFIPLSVAAGAWIRRRRRS